MAQSSPRNTTARRLNHGIRREPAFFFGLSPPIICAILTSLFLLSNPGVRRGPAFLFGQSLPNVFAILPSLFLLSRFKRRPVEPCFWIRLAPPLVRSFLLCSAPLLHSQCSPLLGPLVVLGRSGVVATASFALCRG